MKAKVEFLNEETVIRTTRVLRQPRALDLGQSFNRRLANIRKHHRKWPMPECEIIFNMHWRTYCADRGKWYGEMQLEIPQENGFDYYTIVRGAKTEYDALILVIQALEAEEWYHSFLKHGARFRVTGTYMEQLYKGYL